MPATFTENDFAPLGGFTEADFTPQFSEADFGGETLPDRTPAKAQLQAQMQGLRRERVLGDIAERAAKIGEGAAYYTPLRPTAAGLMQIPQPYQEGSLIPLVSPDTVKGLLEGELTGPRQPSSDPITQGVQEFTADLAAGLTSPEAIETMRLGRPGARVFQAQAIQSTPQAIEGLREAADNGDMKGAVKQALNVGASIAVPLAIEHGLAKSAPKAERFTPEDFAEPAQNAPGRVEGGEHTSTVDKQPPTPQSEATAPAVEPVPEVKPPFEKPLPLDELRNKTVGELLDTLTGNTIKRPEQRPGQVEPATEVPRETQEPPPPSTAGIEPPATREALTGGTEEPRGDIKPDQPLTAGATPPGESTELAPPKAPAVSPEVIRDLAGQVGQFVRQNRDKLSPEDKRTLGKELEQSRVTGDPKHIQKALADVKAKLAPAAKPTTTTQPGVSDYTVLDAVRDHGGLGGPNLDDAIAAMRSGRKPSQVAAEYGGEYDALGNILEEIWTAMREKNRARYNALKKAYGKAGFGGGGKVIDQTLEGIQNAHDQGQGYGRKPETATDLIDHAWAVANGAKPDISPTDLFWRAVDNPKSKVGLKRVNVQDLKIGSKFRVRAPGASHEELTVTHIDPDTGEVQVKDGPSFGLQNLPDGMSIWVQDFDQGTGHMREEPPSLFGKPESVEEQKARLELEEKRRKEAAQREELARRAAKPLEGKRGDIGQKDMFGGGDLFSEEATPEALDRNALHFYGRPFNELHPDQQSEVRRVVENETLPRRQQPNDESRRQPTPDRSNETQSQPQSEQRASEIQRPATPTAPPELKEAARLIQAEATDAAKESDRLGREDPLAKRQSVKAQRAYQAGREIVFQDALDAIAQGGTPEEIQARLQGIVDRHNELLADFRRRVPDWKKPLLRLSEPHRGEHVSRPALLAESRRLQGGTDAIHRLSEILEDKREQGQLPVSDHPKASELGVPGFKIKPGSPEGGFIRIPSREEIVDAFGELPDRARMVFKWAVDQKKRVSARIARSKPHDIVSALKDSADNRATIVSKQAANVVLHELNRAFGVTAKEVKDTRNALREFALTFAVEAGGNRQELGRMRYALTGAQAEGVNLIWKRRALKAIDFAEENWERLQPVADLYQRLTDAENRYENQNGIRTLYRQGGYVFHAQDVDTSFGIPGTGSAQTAGGAPAPFRHIRDYNTYADAIAGGVSPQSLNAVDLLQRRIALGQRLVNYGAWSDGLRSIVDPVTQLPVVTDVETRTRADGTEDVTAPAGYTVQHFAGKNIALHNGYTGLFGDLTRESWMQGREGRKVLMQALGLAKHGMLLFDTYHMGRLAFWNAVTRAGIPRFERGFTLLDNTAAEIRNMIARGEIPAEWGRQLVEAKNTLNEGLKAGLNVGNVGDNLYTDFLQNIPGIGGFNKWLFNKYQRGAMAEVYIIEHARQSRMFPNDTPEQLARRVAKDVNTRFGNLQSQGWIKSKTGQDLARIIFLAPQWNESLIRAELGALRQTAAAPFQSVKAGRPAMGGLARGIGTALVGIFAANQLINSATRGHPTWENPEEGFGAKISAWIPDLGGGPGFFLNPMSVPAEITNLLMRATERHQGDVLSALRDFAAGRFSSLSKGVYTAFTGETPMGVKAKSGMDRAALAVGEAVPFPISGGAAVRFGKQLATGKHEEKYPGQFQKQLMQSAGIKTEQAPDSGRRIFDLAQRFEATKGITQPPTRDIPVYADLTAAIKRQNMDDANEALDKILQLAKGNGEPHTLRDVADYYRQWVKRPFTRNAQLERQFYATLTPAQKQVYDKARQDRVAVARAALQLAGSRVVRQ